MIDKIFKLNIVRLKLDFGAKLFYLARAKNIFVFRITFHQGISLEKEGQNGISNLCLRYLFEGGKKYNHLSLIEALDEIGCEVSLTPQSIQFACLSKFQDTLLDILFDILAQAKLPKRRFSKLKNDLIDELLNLYEDSENEAFELLRKTIYLGTLAERNSLGQVKDLKNLNYQDILDFMPSFLNTSNLRFYIAGDIKLTNFVAKLNYILKELPKGENLTLKNLEIKDLQPKRNLFVYRDRQHSVLHFGHLGVTKHHQDAIALRVADQIFGSSGALSNRLGTLLREELGLCYSVSGDIMHTAGFWPGLMQMQIATANKTVSKAIIEMQNCLTNFLDKGVSKTEVKDAIDYLVGSSYFALEGCLALVLLLREVDLFSLDDDFLLKEKEATKKVTSQMVKDAYNKWVKPDKLITVLVGKTCPNGFTEIKRKDRV